MNWPLLSNSLMLAGTTTLLASALGLAAALALVTAPQAWRRWLLFASLVPLILPSFLVTNCWLDLLGTNGSWRTWLRFNIYSLPGAIALLTLITWPLTTLFVSGALTRLDVSQLDADRALHGLSLLRWLLWPMIRGTVGQAAIIIFVLTINNFAVPVILQVPVFPEELWLALTTRLDESGAWAASVPMVAAPLLVLIVLRSSEISWPGRSSPVPTSLWRNQIGHVWRWANLLVLFLLLFFSVILPLKQLVFSLRTWSELPNLFRAAPATVWNSFFFSATTATLCMGIGLVTWRRRLGPMLWLLFLVPGVLLGRLMISAFDGTVIYGTTTLVIVAFTVRYLALGWQGASLAYREIDRDLTDAGRIDGAIGWSMLRHIVWPQIAPRVLAAGYVTYLLCLWDIETLVLLYPPGGETLALRIFNLLHYGHNAQVNALCLVLLALAAAPFLIWTAWRFALSVCQRR